MTEELEEAALKFHKSHNHSNNDQRVTPLWVIENFLKAHHEKEIEIIKQGPINSLTVDYIDLKEMLEEYGFFHSLKKPKEILQIANNALRGKCQKESMKILLENVPYTGDLRLLDSKDKGKLISTTAMVKSVTPIKTRIKIGIFECRSCMRLHKVQQENEEIKEPAMCKDCGGRSFNLLEEESEFINYQYLKLEEPLELRKGGNTRDFLAYIDGDLAIPDNNINPGDVVNIVGFFEVIINNKEWIFIIKINNFNHLICTFEDIKLDNEDIKRIRSIASQKNVIERFRDSIAPDIYGHEDFKEGIVLQLFSGGIDETKGKNSRRKVNHVLLVGDPGIAKSETLKRICSLSPKGFYVNGAESSKAGLLGAAVKDEFTGKWTIEAGAIPLADQGLICIDEMDKMSIGDLLALNEPMEQQTVTITKAGLNVTMNARTPVLAAANPKNGRFNEYHPIIEQIEIPETVLSRFDLIYALKDKVDFDKDLDLSDHILDQNPDNMGDLSPETIRKYIAYAKREIHPILTKECKDLLGKFYAKTRQLALKNDDIKHITPRDLITVERMTLTIARINLRDYTVKEDVDKAIKIYNNSLKTLGLQPENAVQPQLVRSKN